MASDRFYISAYNKNSGLFNALKPFAVPDKAFAKLNNAYVWRDRVRKRFGSRWLANTQLQTRLRINLGEYRVQVGTTNGVGDLSGTVPGVTFNIGQRFVIGVETDTVTSGAAGAQPMTMTGGTSTTHTFNIGTGAFVLVAAPINTPVYFYFNTTTTSVGGAAAGVVPGIIFKIGQMFSIGTQLYTVWQNGALKTTGAGAGTYNLATGAYSITGAPASTAVYFYPAEPVMGLITYETTSVNNEQTIAFDTQFSYQYINGWERIFSENAPGDALWTGSNSQFFWGTSYGGVSPSDYILYVTNFNELEPNFMRYMQSVAGTLTWFSFRPTIALTTSGSTLNIYLRSARILVPFKNRLLAFNTWEAQDAGAGVTLVHYPFRVRWCAANADPTDQVNNWRQDIPGRGNARDCPTLEAIITVEFIRDRLIVYLERSTWELVYTGNEIYPFDWQQINTELGAESTFSVVPFDTVALGVGNVGIVACSGTNVERIDNNIPDEVWAIHNDNGGVERVYGIRDYFPEMVYWSMPDPTASSVFPYPKKVLIYNYKNATWAFNDDSITCFGYFQPVNGITWDSEEITWDDEVDWDSGSLQAKFRNVIAGNQQGWTFLIDSEAPINASVLQITDITIPVAGINLVSVQSTDFNLEVGDYVYIEGIQSTGNLTLINGTIQRVMIDLTNANNFTFVFGDSNSPSLAGTYLGGGVISRVTNPEILTKAYNFYQEKGRNAAINKIDFLVDATASGKILVDWFVSTGADAMVSESSAISGTGCLLGTSVLDTSPYISIPLEADQSQLWHPAYISANGEFVQLYLHMDDTLQRSVLVRESPFQLHAMCFVTTPTSRLQ